MDSECQAEPRVTADACEAACTGSKTRGPSRRRPGRVLALALLVLVVSCGVLFPAIRTTSFHGDESGWIHSGFYYTRLAASGNLEYDRWDNSRLGAWAALNMNLGKWLLGMPLCLSFPNGDRDYHGLYDFQVDLSENRRRGGVPPDDVLHVARRASATAGVLCCLVLFAIGTVALNEWAGLVAAGLTLMHRIFVQCTTRAMTDSFYLLFLLCLCLALVYFARAERKRDLVRTAAACGLFVGLACSIKVTALPLGVAAFGLCGLIRAARGRLEARTGLQCAGMVLILALGTTYALNPYFWPVVVGPAATRASVDAGAPPAEVRKSLDFRSVGRFPQLFWEWKRFMDRQRAEGLGDWTGNRLVDLHRSLLTRFGALPLEKVWIPLAVLLVVGRCVRSKPGDETEAWWSVVAFCAANYLFLLLFLVLNWNRYYLTTLVAGRVILALAVVWSIKQLWQRRSELALGE